MSTSPAVDVAANEDWKQEISARVQAHRTRRKTGQPGPPPQGSRRLTTRAAGVAATVAERYAQAPSYNEYLSGLPLPAPAPVTDISHASLFSAGPIEQETSSAGPEPQPVAEIAPTLEAALDSFSAIAPELHIEAAETNQQEPQKMDTFLAQVVVEPHQPLASKLIEFPRQLIAARKARPRISEGPLLEDAHDPSQLRIFEAEGPAALSDTAEASTASAATAAAGTAEWRYIQLDTPLLSSAPATARTHFAGELFELPLHVAPLQRRLLAAAMDFCLVCVGWLVFAAGLIAVESHPPSDLFAALAAFAVFAALAFGYQWLFLSLSDSTPGMRYARIALCTFNDDNPNWRVRRSRVSATFLSAAALGLGFAWTLFDTDRLGWHDRISRTYQRCY